MFVERQKQRNRVPSLSSESMIELSVDCSMIDDSAANLSCLVRSYGERGQKKRKCFFGQLQAKECRQIRG